MELEINEIKLVKVCIEERQRQLNKNIDEWAKIEWDNLGGMQNMYANKQAFEDMKDATLKTLIRENNDLEELLERIYEEI